MRMHKLPTDFSENSPKTVVSCGKENKTGGKQISSTSFEGFPEECHFQPPFVVPDHKAGVLPAASERRGRNKRQPSAQKAAKRTVSRFQAPLTHNSPSVASIMFRVVGGKGYSLGDDGDVLFRTRCTFVSIFLDEF